MNTWLEAEADHEDSIHPGTRYLMYDAGVTDGDTLVTMMGDAVDLWERAAVDGTPVRAIVGDDPVEFAETFARAYNGMHWIDKERARLVTAIEDAERASRDDRAARVPRGVSPPRCRRADRGRM